MSGVDLGENQGRRAVSMPSILPYFLEGIKPVRSQFREKQAGI